MAEYGRNVINASTGYPLEVCAGTPAEWMPIGVSIDWSLVAAVSGSPVTLASGLVIPIGSKYLRYGQVLTRVTAAGVQTLTISGTPTGGTFTISGTRLDNSAYVTTGAIAFDAVAATIQTALRAVFGSTSIVVAGSGPFTITTPLGLLTGNGAALTGGTSPAATIVMTTPVANSGKFGPYDFAATDGRQTCSRGHIGILNTTVLENGLVAGIPTYSSNHPGVLVGGLVWRDRIIATTGTHSLANGPTFTEMEAAMPRLEYVPSV